MTTGSATHGGPAVAALRRVLAAEPAAPVGERCQLCAAPVADRHSHVVDLDSRALLCSCRPCALLFDHDGAASGRYRAVPQRFVSVPSFRLSAGQWDDLAVPVGIAFFFHNSRLDRTVACYPSPAGATESQLPLGRWDDVVADNPDLSTLRPDVEAILVRARSGGFDCYLVPIDSCYELVGHLRLLWRGFDGGQDVHRRIEQYFADVQTSSRVARLPSGASGGP